MAGENIERIGSIPWVQQLSNVYWMLIAFTIAAFGFGVYTENELFLLLPFALVVGLATFYNFHYLYYSFFLLLPFSVEIYFSNGMGTDLPTEPVMLVLTGILILKFINQFHRLDLKRWLHPISIILLSHLLWIYFISIYSVNTTVSLKYALAKTWYILPFFYLSLFVFKARANYKIQQVLKCLWWSLFVAICYVMLRHAAEGFSFASINDALKPIFRNHVNYAGILVAVLPYLFYLYKNEKRKAVYGLSLIHI